MIWIKSYIRISFVDWPKFWNFCFSEIVLRTYQVLKIHTNKYGKSLLNCMPYVLKVCSHALHVYVLTCQHVLRAYMLSCQRVLQAHVPYVLTCLRANIPCVLMRWCPLRTYILTCQCALRTYMLTCQCALCAFVLLGKTWVNLQYILVLKLYTDFFWPAFSFSPVLIQQL